MRILKAGTCFYSHLEITYFIDPNNKVALHIRWPHPKIFSFQENAGIERVILFVIIKQRPTFQMMV